MWKYAALLSYSGTQYCGWQKQKGSAADGAPSIQETIEKALRKMTCETELSIVGSGRTDSGVHAIGQVAHFTLKKKEWNSGILLKGLNGLLPSDIQALGVHPVGLDFHAQRSAIKKQYGYYFQQGPSAIPHLEPYTWWIRKELNLSSMAQALEVLVGEHDFKPFQASGANLRSTVRKILEAQVSLETVPFPIGAFAGSALNQGKRIGLVRVRLVGTGFLKQMVRGICGTLLQVGEDRRLASCMEEILLTRDRSRVGPTAPSRALWLEQVWYPESYDLPWQCC